MPRPKAGYKLLDGTRVPGVTTIIGRFKDSSALMHWAFKQGQRAERGEIDSLYDDRDKAAASGTLAHNLIEAYLRKQDPPPCDDPLADNAFRQAKAWLSETSITLVDSEVSLVSERYGFGGTIDAVGTGPGGLVILDWKTSGNIYPENLMQVAAYGLLWTECRPESPAVAGYRICRFSKDEADFSMRSYDNLDDAKEFFLLLKQAYNLDKKLKERV